MRGRLPSLCGFFTNFLSEARPTPNFVDSKLRQIRPIASENRGSPRMSRIRRASTESVCTLYATQPCHFLFCRLGNFCNSVITVAIGKGLFQGSQRGRAVVAMCAPVYICALRCRMLQWLCDPMEVLCARSKFVGCSKV